MRPRLSAGAIFVAGLFLTRRPSRNSRAGAGPLARAVLALLGRARSISLGRERLLRSGGRVSALAEYRGLARSLWMYYGDPRQRRRMGRFYAQLIRRGDLCFDIGAHVGSRVGVWARLGARVVAVEPLPRCVSLLRLLHGRRAAVEVVQAAVGAQEGAQELLVSDREPTVSTLSPAWAAAMKGARRNFAPTRWDSAVRVPVTTLDALIRRYGEPAFCKVDTEGYEVEVLRGLSRPLRALSFEHVPPVVEPTLACLERLGQLGEYEFNWSPGETMALHWPEWVGADEVEALLRGSSADELPGDVYARLRGA